MNLVALKGPVLHWNALIFSKTKEIIELQEKHMLFNWELGLYIFIFGTRIRSMEIVEQWGIETSFGHLHDSSSHVGLYLIVKFQGSSFDAWVSLKSSQNSFVLIGFLFNVYRETTIHHYGDHCPGPFTTNTIWVRGLVMNSFDWSQMVERNNLMKSYSLKGGPQYPLQFSTVLFTAGEAQLTDQTLL